MGESKSNHKVVILLHGIRTRAWWQGPVSSRIRKKTGATVIPIKYDRFDLIRFLVPSMLFKRKALDKIHFKINEVLSNYKHSEVTIIAHSFGTFAISKILEKDPSIYFHKIVLCGSIIHKDYNWNHVQLQIGKHPHRDFILNECGIYDPFPILAGTVTWGYGASGTDGFGGAKVTDRYHKLSHSEFLDVEFVEDYWVDYINDNKIEPSETDQFGFKPPWYFSLFRINFKYWIPIILIAFALVPIMTQDWKSGADRLTSSLVSWFRKVIPSFETGFEQTSIELDSIGIFQECDYCPSMQIVEGRSFIMGDSGPDGEFPRRRVSVKRVAVSRYEITRAEFSATNLPIEKPCAVGAQKGVYEYARDAEYPVTCLSWSEA